MKSDLLPAGAEGCLRTLIQVKQPIEDVKSYQSNPFRSRRPKSTLFDDFSTKHEFLTGFLLFLGH